MLQKVKEHQKNSIEYENEEIQRRKKEQDERIRQQREKLEKEKSQRKAQERAAAQHNQNEEARARQQTKEFDETSDIIKTVGKVATFAGTAVAIVSHGAVAAFATVVATAGATAYSTAQILKNVHQNSDKEDKFK